MITSEDGPLVLLPGMNCSSRLWASPPDGATVVPWLTEASIDAQVARLLDELPSRFALAGLSLGGIVAMALVRTAPERVSRLVLMATNPRAPTPAQLDAWRVQRGRLADGDSARDLQRELLPDLLRPGTIATRPEVVAQVLTMADDVGEQTLDRQLAMQASRTDARPGLPSITCPTHVIAGAEDRICRPDRLREIARLVPGAHLDVLPDAAHLIPLDAPAALAQVLPQWSRH